MKVAQRRGGPRIPGTGCVTCAQTSITPSVTGAIVTSVLANGIIRVAPMSRVKALCFRPRTWGITLQPPIRRMQRLRRRWTLPVFPPLLYRSIRPAPLFPVPHMCLLSQNPRRPRSPTRLIFHARVRHWLRRPRRISGCAAIPPFFHAARFPRRDRPRLRRRLPFRPCLPPWRLRRGIGFAPNVTG